MPRENEIKGLESGKGAGHPRWPKEYRTGWTDIERAAGNWPQIKES
jgi:hypothetical protein